MKIEIAGPGCPKCQATEKNVRDACAELGIDAEIEHLTDPRVFGPMGVIMTPAAIIDGTVVVSGRVPTVEMLKEEIAKRGG